MYFCFLLLLDFLQDGLECWLLNIERIERLLPSNLMWQFHVQRQECNFASYVKKDIEHKMFVIFNTTVDMNFLNNWLPMVKVLNLSFFVFLCLVWIWIEVLNSSSFYAFQKTHSTLELFECMGRRISKINIYDGRYWIF